MNFVKTKKKHIGNENKDIPSHGGILDYYLNMLLEVSRLLRSCVSLKKTKQQQKELSMGEK